MRVSLKTVLLTALLMTLPTVAAGQLRLGFRGGLSLATLEGDNVENPNSRTAVNFGGFFNVPVSNVLGVQVGAGFVQKGASETEGGLDIEGNLSYIEIPLLLTLSPATSGNVGFDFYLGPALGFNTGCTLKGTFAGVTSELDCDDPQIDADVKSFDVGAMVGAGVEIGLTPTLSLVLDGFYNLGLTNFDDSGDVDNETKNRAFSILAGLSFSVGG